MDLVPLFGTAFVVGLSGAMMPGPLLTVTIAESARRGWRAGPLLVLGHGLLEGILVLVLAVGFAAILTRHGVTAAIAVLGGAFLVYLGYGMVRDAWYGRVELPAPAALTTPNPASLPVAREGRGLHPVLAGILVSLANPYWSLWWATVGLHYINMAARQGSVGLVAFFTGHIMADLAWYCLVAVAVGAGRHLFPAVVYRGVLVVCGLCLVGLGMYFAFTGIT
jgi:threonine/homoserine/homoserine lactone efflux protein